MNGRKLNLLRSKLLNSSEKSFVSATD